MSRIAALHVSTRAGGFALVVALALAVFVVVVGRVERGGPIRVVARFISRSSKRLAVTIVGFALLLAGTVLLVLPGPGLPLIVGGLALLATEYAWAERALAHAKRRAANARDRVRRRRRPG